MRCSRSSSCWDECACCSRHQQVGHGALGPAENEYAAACKQCVDCMQQQVCSSKYEGRCACCSPISRLATGLWGLQQDSKCTDFKTMILGARFEVHSTRNVMCCLDTVPAAPLISRLATELWGLHNSQQTMCELTRGRCRKNCLQRSDMCSCNVCLILLPSANLRRGSEAYATQQVTQQPAASPLP
jgi:hypothetical protein